MFACLIMGRTGDQALFEEIIVTSSKRSSSPPKVFAWALGM
jgi:hypothetical protein